MVTTDAPFYVFLNFIQHAPFYAPVIFQVVRV